MKYGLVLFLICGCTGMGQAPDGGQLYGPPVSVVSGKLERAVLIDGNLVSPSTAPVVIQRIRYYWDYNISWTAEEGSIVKEGDPIIKLDPSTIQKDLTEREIELESSRLKLEEEEIRAIDDLEDAKAEVETRRFQLEKQKLLVVNNDSVSLNERKKQQLEVANARKRLRRAEEKVQNVKRRTKRSVEVQKLRVKNAEEEVKEMRAGLDKMTLKAPSDGLLVFPLFSTNSGYMKAVAGGGVRVNTVVAEVADPNDLVARVYVPEIDADGISKETTGTMVLDIEPGKSYPGKVLSVSGVPSTPSEREGGRSNDPEDNVRQFEVMFRLDKLPSQAMPGMTVRVNLLPVTKADVLKVPIEALSLKPLTAGSDTSPGSVGEGDVAFVSLRRDGDWSWQEIKLGTLSLSHAEVVSGLKAGDEVRALIY